MEKIKKILAGINHDNELYFINVTTERNGKPYFSITGDIHMPITVEEAIERTEEQNGDEELAEYWKQAVQNDKTTQSLSDWAEDVRSETDDIGGIDNSIFDISVTVDGKDYIFESMACGQHKEKTLKHYFIEQIDFRMLQKAWELYHMSEKDVYTIVLPSPYNMVSVGYMLDNMPKQNIEALAMQAITIINSGM